jgi:hypothetical protein
MSKSLIIGFERRAAAQAARTKSNRALARFPLPREWPR